MAKNIKLEPLGQEAAIQTNANILSILLEKELNVLPECGGRGACATCHVYIKSGMESLSPIGRREQRTLGVINAVQSNSRLACQALVLGDGVVVEVPAGMYVNDIADIQALIGRRTEQDILNPINGQVVVEAGKLITRSMISQLQDTRTSIDEYLAHTTEA